MEIDRYDTKADHEFLLTISKNGECYRIWSEKNKAFLSKDGQDLNLNAEDLYEIVDKYFKDHINDN